MDHQRASRLRQNIQEQVEILARLTQAAQERCGLFAGSLYERRRRCGKRRCRCVRGALHRDSVLAVIGSNGRRRVISVAGPEINKVAGLTLSHRRFRKARAEMVCVFGKLLEIFDELGRLRQVEPWKLFGASALRKKHRDKLREKKRFIR